MWVERREHALNGGLRRLFVINLARVVVRDDLDRALVIIQYIVSRANGRLRVGRRRAAPRTLPERAAENARRQDNCQCDYAEPLRHAMLQKGPLRATARPTGHTQQI